MFSMSAYSSTKEHLYTVMTVRTLNNKIEYNMQMTK